MENLPDEVLSDIFIRLLAKQLAQMSEARTLPASLETIVAFDMGAETFREIPLPHSILHHHGSRYHYLGIFAGKLCVMLGVEGGKCEVWVNDEYGVAESWVKHHAFSQFSYDIFPYGFTSRNELLFQSDLFDEHFSLYDPVAAKTKTFKIKGVYGLNKIVEYVDSLVWVAPAKCERSCNISLFHT